MSSLKLNLNDCKRFRIEVLELSQISVDVDHLIALEELCWEPLKVDGEKTKARMMYKHLNKLHPTSLTSDILSGLCLRKTTNKQYDKKFYV